MSDIGYAGDVSPREAWDILEKDSNAVLVDCRTMPEWKFVGIPDLSGLGRRPVLVEWNRFPDGVQNAAFVDQVQQDAGDPGRALLFLCRSGARSRAAAIAMTAAGHGPCYNIAGGFEGDHDAERHRGRTNGWKVSGLPWMQE